MIKLFRFTFFLVLLIAATLWFVEQPGSVQIIWHDYLIETSAAMLGLAVAVLGVTLYALLRLGHFIRHGGTMRRLRRQLKNQHDGHQYLAQGITAIASGNAPEAGRLAIMARKKLGTTTHVHALQAQAAQLAGDFTTAREIYHTLMNDPESRAIGYRGLINDAKRREDWTEAGQLVEDFYKIDPNAPWLNLVRFDLLIMRHDWRQANQSLAILTKTRLLDTRTIQNAHATILIALSQQEAVQGHLPNALQLAEQAQQQKPNWMPALINLVQQQARSGHKRAADRTITKNWSAHPHPQLAAIYCQGTTNTLDAYKKLCALCHKNSSDRTNSLILAEGALAANIWGEARRYLTNLIKNGLATQSVYKLMMRLERSENGDERTIRQWLDKALSAPPDPVWLCESCGGTHHEWQPTCSHCHHFNTLDWQSPGVSRKPMALSSAPVHSWIG